MPYLLRTISCLFALSAVLVPPLAMGSDAIAADGGTSATSTQVVANSNDGQMVPSSNSFNLAKLLANNHLVIYPNAGHWVVFEYHENTPCPKR